jgi:hypothetical protein
MWALLGQDNKTVIGSYTPDIPVETVIQNVEQLGLVAIKIHIGNSPAFIKGYYENGKFYERKEK